MLYICSITMTDDLDRHTEQAWPPSAQSAGGENQSDDDTESYKLGT